MPADIRQIVLFLIAVFVPLLLLRRRYHRLLLGWVCLTLFIQIFDTSILTNLYASRIVGLLYLPQALTSLREWIKLKPVKSWWINFCYLLGLAVLFGFIFPWPDITLSRPFNLTASGRALVYSVRLLSDFSLAMFVAGQMLQPGTLLFIARTMLAGATANALAGILYFFTKFDLFYLITGTGEQVLASGRARGFAGEPRGLGLVCAYGVMITLLAQKKVSPAWPALLVINLVGLLVTYSTSSLSILLAGITASWLFLSLRVRSVIIGVVVFTVLFVTSIWLFLPQQFELAITTIQYRVDPNYKLASIPPGTLGEEVAYRLDVFDASALLFLLDQPLYALTGTGPGMVSLPASYYVPPGLYSAIWTPDVGINSLPFHGLLLEVSNSGLPGLILWLIQIITCWKALRKLARLQPQGENSGNWEFAQAIFLIATVFYVVQVSPLPVWSVFLGIGWAACRLLGEAELSGFIFEPETDWTPDQISPAISAAPGGFYQPDLRKRD